MMDPHVDFERRTADTIRDCARWMDEHADSLARSFCGDMGCQGWSIHFDANTGYDPDGMGLPVTVNTVNQRLGTIDYRRD